MATLVATFTAVLLSQLDAVPFDLVLGPDVNAVGADNFQVLFDFGRFECPLWNFITRRDGLCSETGYVQKYLPAAPGMSFLQRHAHLAAQHLVGALSFSLILRSSKKSTTCWN
jgi:hypothetical protein